MKRPVATPFLLAWLTACTSQPQLDQKGFLDFLQDGATAKEEVYLRLGSPSATYENERILTFRLAQDDAGYYLSGGQRGWAGVRYSLVLAFDENGVLRQHSLVPVRSP